ncbi:MAG: hypothetical protein M1608_07885 [Candidatus Omnitrophica bacterium]|nr:hypothetical protein [Candidatus Omnitrophota bacterium]
MTPEFCPHCSPEVPANAKVCPECGSTEETGWSEEAKADYLGLPDDSFDYDEFVRSEFGGEDHSRRKVRWYWWVAIGLMVLALLGLLW